MAQALVKACLAVLLLIIAAHAAFAEKRVALVIGNSAYVHAPALDNPKNDANDMAAALKALGFTVILGLDLDKRGMERKILEFESALSGADAGVFHYSGHGLQVAGANYLVPVDAELASAAALRIEGVRLDFIQETMEREAKTNILFLDACRNNPLARNLARALGTRSADIGRGLAPVEAGVGTLIGFSTQPGNVALDGSGRNSPYSGPLIKAIGTTGQDISTILIAVRNAVLAATNDKQVPWEHTALRAPFYFNPGAALAPAQPLSPQAPEAEADAAREWAAVDKESAAMLKTFLSRHGKSSFAPYAQARLDELVQAGGGSGSSWWPWSSAQRPEQGKPGAAQQTAVVAPQKPAPVLPAKDACEDGLLVSVAAGEEPCIKPGSGESFKDCPECPEMVIVAEGSFVMGSPDSEPQHSIYEGPQHKVRFDKPFAVGRFAVTFAEWDACEADGGCGGYIPQDAGWGRADRPVIKVSWNDAKAYVAWLSKKTGKEYRLLSEAEREYVARAGTATPFWWGSSITPEQANYEGSAEPYKGGGQRGEWRQKTLPVKLFQPNPWGLYQVHGNVWEWVEDCWHGSYTGAPSDGSAWTTGECTRHVLRGGSWFYAPQDLRSAYRFFNDPVSRYFSIGFRVARTLTP